MEKMAEKISVELTEEQNDIFEKVNTDKFALDVSGSFESVSSALYEMKKIVSDLDIKSGDIALVENKEDKKHNLEQIKTIKKYRTPLKKKRADVNKSLKAYSKDVLSNFDELIKEFDTVVDYMESGVEIYDENQRKFREQEKRLIFEGVEKQFPGFTFTWDEKFINSSREVIESDLIDQMKKEKARRELIEAKEDRAKYKIMIFSKEYEIKQEVSYEALSHLYNFGEMDNEEIDEEVEKYILSIQVSEAEAEEKECARLEAEKKQREYDEKKAKEEQEKKEKEEAELKSKTIKEIIEYGEHEESDLEGKVQETLEFILDTLTEKKFEKIRKEESERLAKKQEEAEKKRIADEEKAEKERLRKEAENAKSKTLLISVECVDKYTDDFKTMLEAYLEDHIAVKKYAVKVKGE